MAEAITRRHATDVIEPSSAGLAPLGYIVEPTKETLIANGYPVEGLSSKRLSADAIAGADLIVNLSGHPIDYQPIFDRAKVEEWRVEDPYGADPATYQRILEEIEGRVLLLAARFRSRTKPTKPEHA
jgi:protein-tyrosine-phosphatase